jgi:hypothetical protein
MVCSHGDLPMKNVSCISGNALPGIKKLRPGALNMPLIRSFTEDCRGTQ